MPSHSAWARVVRRCFTLASALLLSSSLVRAADPSTSPSNGRYIATAYSVTGITQSGQYTHKHVVATDPAILPIGSRVCIRHVGKYSGEYVVADTGEKLVGRKLDIYIPNTAECRKFGKKVVQVKVLGLGDGTHSPAKQADQAVKKYVSQDLAHGVVGQAATQTDWAAKGSVAKTPAGGASNSKIGNPREPTWGA